MEESNNLTTKKEKKKEKTKTKKSGVFGCFCFVKVGPQKHGGQ